VKSLHSVAPLSHTHMHTHTHTETHTAFLHNALLPIRCAPFTTKRTDGRQQSRAVRC